jgi:hypothetical protein
MGEALHSCALSDPPTLRRYGRLRCGLAASLLLSLSGCAFDNVGFLASRVTSAEGAWVVDVYSAGAYLHTRADDPGLQFGIGRRSYVFDKRDEKELTPGWHYFTASLPQRQSYARDSRTLGLDTTFARNDMSVTLGLRATTVMARVDVADSQFYRLTYLPAQPAQTRLEIMQESGGDVACLSCGWSKTPALVQ